MKSKYFILRSTQINLYKTVPNLCRSFALSSAKFAGLNSKF